MKVFPILGLVFLFATTSTFSQEITRTQKVQLIADLSDKIQSLENDLLEPTNTDRELSNSKGLTAIRLLPRGTFGEHTFGRGGGAYYSFSAGSHSYNRTPQIELQGKEFSVGFAGADYGFITDLGSRSISALETSAPELKFMSEYRAPRYENEIRAEARSFHSRKIDGLQYGRGLGVVEGHSYLLRAITFDEADILVGFDVLRIDDDGSVIIAYKKLVEFDKPLILSMPDKDMKTAVEKIVAELGIFIGVSIEVKNNVVILRGKLDNSDRQKFYDAYAKQGLRIRNIEMRPDAAVK